MYKTKKHQKKSAERLREFQENGGLGVEPPTDVLLDRDLSWLEFNRRVLHEALDARTPLLERLKFLAIFSSNLDEFFMKRVGRLRGKVALDASADQSRQQLQRIREVVLSMLADQAEVLTKTLLPELTRHGIQLLTWEQLDDTQRATARDYFRRNVFPILTPLAVDPGHPFPFISNLSISLGIILRPPDSDERLFARLKVPDSLPQWLPLPDGDGRGPRQCFVRLRDVVSHNLADLFPGMSVLEVMPFRVTRNITVEQDEDESPESLVHMVEQELRQRRFERTVRLQYAPNASPSQVQLLLRKLDLTEADAYESPAELDYTGLFAIAGLNRPELRDPPWQPLMPSAFADEDDDVFAVIRQGDVLVHHPYESFDASVARFLRAAADDPKVLALKMTVYRVGSDTPFVDALIRAAEAGKQVACLVELTARMDERQNLYWARMLEKVGVHVVYGVVGLKTHAKTTLVVRQDDDGLRCYVHVGTGNYHVKTAKLYTDLGLFTCDPALTADVVDLFHYLTGRSRKQDYRKLLVAPVTMRRRFLEMIAREVEHQRAGRPAHITAKFNQLEDPAICEALVEASQAGLGIDLLIRGFCTLAPGIPGKTDNIRIVSVVGRFLEHSRIYHFRNGAKDPVDGEFYIGSADWMSRNLSDRVEAIAPIELRAHRERLWEIIQIQLRDHRQAWDLQPDGAYVQRTPPKDGDPNSPEVLGTHQTLMSLTRQRVSALLAERS
ncbi:MAG: polyphosphate kinase 1 [Gemmataceae bacterium]|nr:polyphosphate kinase 1 [Gemmataceae bacterium]